jgi:lipoprotein-releasing system ATP-binding protein
MLKVESLVKEYSGPRGPVAVLSGVSLSLSRGDSLAVMGPSGAGKSTLLYIVGTLETPTSGTVTLADRDPFRLGERELAEFRNQEVGFVFQDHCLLPQLTVLENVLAPTLVAPPGEGYEARARALLGAVGLADRLDHRPGELSGGEKQRVALARALVCRPTLLLCDEPTGNLDRKAADAVAGLLTDLHREQQTVLIVVTHSPEFASRFSIRRELVDGRLQ